jgi:serine/threonine-protein kinase RsbW
MVSKSKQRCEFKSKDLVLRMETTIPAEVRSISPVVTRVMKLARQLGCAEGREMELETALREALANAIVHGSQSDSNKEVQCCVACDESRGMLIIVRDSGKGFDPASIPSPVAGQNVFSSHGRGIFLINQLVDEVSFERGGTEIHMWID